MRVLGLDPSLTNYGWAYHDTSAPYGDPSRVVARGRFQTPSRMEFLDRYTTMRSSLRELIQARRPDKVGIEFPIFGNDWSEGMYGLFLYSCEALKAEKCDVVFWTPLQAKAHARECIERPKGWPMDKKDMSEAAYRDTTPDPVGVGNWNHNEADAYLVGVLSGRFWEHLAGNIPEDQLTPVEKRYFTRVHTYLRGRKAGRTERTGMIYREDDRFFAWATQEE